MKHFINYFLCLSLLATLWTSTTKASILPGTLLQYALYEKDYSSSLFAWKYDTSTETYYICNPQFKYSCSLWNALFKIKYNSTLWAYYICEWNVWYCDMANGLFTIKEWYVCPWGITACGAWNSIWVPPSLIPIESIITSLEWAESSVTKNLSKMNKSNWTYYICNSSVATCWNASDFMQIKYDSNNETYYICDWDTATCSSVSDFIQIKYDSFYDTYYVCDWDTVTCSNISEFMQIKYDSNNKTYYICDSNTITCGSVSDYLQVKKDWENYYTCDWNTVSCFVSTAAYQTVVKGTTSSNTSSNGWSSIIVSEESWNMLSNKYDEARSLIEKWNYDEATKLLNEVLSYEWTIFWWDNYDLAKKALSILEEAKTNTKTSNANASTNIQYKEYTSKYSEMKDAIEWMYDNWLTIYKDVDKFLPYNEITREQASKFFVEFAAKVLWKDKWQVYGYDIFSDMGKADPTLRAHIVYANNMWLFKGSNWKFMPLNKLTKAQAIAVLIRIVDWYLDESWTSPYYDKNMVPHYWWYVKYMWNLTYYNLDKRDIAKNVDKLDSENITRWDLWILIYEMAAYLYNHNK